MSGNNVVDIVDETDAVGKEAALRDSSCNTTNLDQVSNLKAGTCEDGLRGGSSDAKVVVNCFVACLVDVSE